ncbi:MAG: tyrosine-type recombinase/integrase, partial [Phycisphaerae bacterium]|nr:tyrosine-type recombinase/integrase [Phycisphaerae bacterium]
RVPKLRHHKASGQAYVVLNSNAVYLGRHGTAAATERYHQTIGEWLASGRSATSEPENITVKEVVARYWQFTQRYYVRPNGEPSYEVNNIRQALRPLCKLYGQTKAIDFGPLALRAVRQRMIDIGWCRKNINRMVDRLKRTFRWATENELLPGNVYQTLRTVGGLKYGRSDAGESEPITPVPQNRINAIQPFVSRQVWAMIQLQLFTAARSGEIVIMRPCDIDRSGRIWIYRPEHHKTAHHGYQRNIYIGPRAQAILQPFLLRDPQAYCFSPAESQAEWRKKRHAARKTPLNQGNQPGTNRRANSQRKAGKQYATTSYGHAIANAVRKAFPPPAPLAKREGETQKQYKARLTDEQLAEIKTWYKQFHWHPHQLRHNAATELRKEFGLEAARVILGHRSAAITEVYAEMDRQKAIDAMMKVG